MQYEKSCGAIVVNLSGREPLYLLVLQRAGHWSPPKGSMEEGEDEELTARREVKEETGLDVRLLGEFRVQSQYVPANKPGVMKTVIFRLADVLEGDLRCNGKDSLDCQWFDLHQAKEKVIFQDTKDILEQADAYLRSMVYLENETI